MGLGRLGCVAASILVGAVQCASGGNPTVRPSIAIEPSALKFHLADWDRDGFADLNRSPRFCYGCGRLRSAHASSDRLADSFH